MSLYFIFGMAHNSSYLHTTSISFSSISYMEGGESKGHWLQESTRSVVDKTEDFTISEMSTKKQERTCSITSDMNNFPW